MEMQPQQPQQAVPPESAPQGGTSIELMIGDDGSFTVSVEAGDTEGGNTAQAKTLDEALNMIRTIAQSVMQNSSPEAQQEDAAYKQEMAPPQ